MRTSCELWVNRNLSVPLRFLGMKLATVEHYLFLFMYVFPRKKGGIDIRPQSPVRAALSLFILYHLTSSFASVTSLLGKPWVLAFMWILF